MEGACPRLPTLVGTLVFSIATASNSVLEFCHEATSIGVLVPPAGGVYRGPTGRTAQDQHWCSRLSGTDWLHCTRPTLALAFRHRATSIGDCTRPTLVSLPHRATPTEGTGLKTCTGWLGSPMFVNLSPSDEVYWGPTGLNTQNQHWSDCRCL
jgi:hypothetical protein